MPVFGAEKRDFLSVTVFVVRRFENERKRIQSRVIYNSYKSVFSDIAFAYLGMSVLVCAAWI